MLYRRNIENVAFTINSVNMKRLLERCKEQPLYHAYMFYLGLLAGGKLLMRYIPPEWTNILQFEEDTKYLMDRFKSYLNATIMNVEEQNKFIDEVNESYSLIEKCFDEFSPIRLQSN
jgi:heme oxygenase